VPYIVSLPALGTPHRTLDTSTAPPAPSSFREWLELRAAPLK